MLPPDMWELLALIALIPFKGTVTIAFDGEFSETVDVEEVPQNILPTTF